MEADAHGEPSDRAAIMAGPLGSSGKADKGVKWVDKMADDQQCGFSTLTSDPRLSSPTEGTESSLHSSSAVVFHASADTETPAVTSAATTTSATALAAVRRVRCVPARDYHTHDVARLMEGFVSSEPLLAAASVSDALLADANFRQRLVDWTNSLIRRGLSVVALEDDTSREDGDDDGDGGVVIAALLNFVMHRDVEAAALDDEAATAFSVCLKHPAAVAIEDGIARVEAKADVFGWLGADTALAIGYAMVSPQRRGGGILSRLLSAGEALAVRRGLQAAVCAASSAFSQSVLRRLGYEELASTEYDGLLDPTLFDLSKLASHRCMALLGKRLC